MPDIQEFQPVLDFLLGLPGVAVYSLIAACSTLDNIFPIVPSDTFVIAGAVLADRGVRDPAAIFATAWVANTAGALFVYGLARRQGRSVFEERRWGRRLLRPQQLRSISRFYRRHGPWAIFFFRCIPVLRMVVPAFAGFVELGAVRALVPIIAASFVWNALMVWAGIFFSRNVNRLLEVVGQANAGLLAVAVVVAGLIAIWWFRSRREEEAGAAPSDSGG